MNTSYQFSSTSFFYLAQNDHPKATIPIPIDSIETPIPIPIPVQFPISTLTSAAVKIQAFFRSHLIRSLVNKIRSVNADADRLEHQIQRQETVDVVRKNERERLRVNESLMALLLRLDSVPGYFDPAVRELRRNVSRRIVGLQEVLDAIVGAVDGGSEGFPGSWEEILERIWGGEEGEEEREGKEERGFECLEKFIMGA